MWEGMVSFWDRRFSPGPFDCDVFLCREQGFLGEMTLMPASRRKAGGMMSTELKKKVQVVVSTHVRLLGRVNFATSIHTANDEKHLCLIITGPDWMNSDCLYRCRMHPDLAVLHVILANQNSKWRAALITQQQHLAPLKIQSENSLTSSWCYNEDWRSLYTMYLLLGHMALSLQWGQCIRFHHYWEVGLHILEVSSYIVVVGHSPHVIHGSSYHQPLQHNPKVEHKMTIAVAGRYDHWKLKPFLYARFKWWLPMDQEFCG